MTSGSDSLDDRISPGNGALLPFRYIDDLVTKEEAIEMLEKAAEGKAEREERLLAEGYPAYTTQAIAEQTNSVRFSYSLRTNCFRSAG